MLFACTPDSESSQLKLHCQLRFGVTFALLQSMATNYSGIFVETLIIILKSKIKKITKSEANISNAIMASYLLTISYLSPNKSIPLLLLVSTTLFYCFCTNKLSSSPLLSPLIQTLIKESQGLVIIYILFRLAGELLGTEVAFSLLFYIGSLVLFILATIKISKIYNQLPTREKLAFIMAVFLYLMMFIEYCYDQLSPPST